MTENHNAIVTKDPNPVVVSEVVPTSIELKKDSPPSVIVEEPPVVITNTVPTAGVIKAVLTVKPDNSWVPARQHLLIFLIIFIFVVLIIEAILNIL